MKSARQSFPDQEGAYENAKLVLVSQLELLDTAIRGWNA